MRIRWPTCASVLVLASCAAPHQIRDRSDFLAEAAREYRGESSERVIRAAEIVLKLSDPNDFEFRHSLNGFTGLRRYVIYAVLAAAQGREKWDLITEVTPGGVRASISVSEAGVASGGYSAQAYEGAMASVPLYRLFWARVDYMLGRRPDWVTCGEAAAELEKSNTNTSAALGGLCGPTSDGRDAPAPEPLPALARSAPPAPPPPSRGRGKQTAPSAAIRTPGTAAVAPAPAVALDPVLSESDRMMQMRN